MSFCEYPKMLWIWYVEDKYKTIVGKCFPNTYNSLTYPLHLFSMFRPQQWLGKVNSALCKWRKALMGGSTLRVHVFLACSFSMVPIPIEGRERTLVSERSLQRQRWIHWDTKLAVPVCYSMQEYSLMKEISSPQNKSNSLSSKFCSFLPLTGGLGRE